LRIDHHPGGAWQRFHPFYFNAWMALVRLAQRVALTPAGITVIILNIKYGYVNGDTAMGTTLSPKKFRIKYIFPKEYNPGYANGAFGGPTPNKELVISFYQERHGLPNEQCMTIYPDGTPPETHTTDPGDHADVIVRFVTGGITMNLATAKSIRVWLDQHISQLEKIIATEAAK